MRENLQALLQTHRRDSPERQVRNFAGRIERQFVALWTFIEREGVEPTNNEAERMPSNRGFNGATRSYGCHSLGGCHFAERILSVIQTLRKQGRDVLDYLSAAIRANRTAAPTRPSFSPPKGRLNSCQNENL